MNKQIEEMAKDIACKIAWDEDEIPTVNCLETAKRLYNAGYRKQIEAENMAMYPTDAFECSLCGWSNWDLATGDGTYKFCPPTAERR